MLMEWIPLHSAYLDAQLQGITILVSNPIIRAIVNMVLKAFSPPQPVTVAANEGAALEFLSERCAGEPRNWKEEKLRLRGTNK